MADANPYDQFDPAPAAAGSEATSGPNPYDQFDPAEQQAGGSLSSVAEAPFVGFNKGLANTLGAPVDAATWAINKGLAQIPQHKTLSDLVTGNEPKPYQIENPFGGSESIKKGLGLIGANPDTHQPHSTLEKVLQSTGEGAAAMAVPSGMVTGLAKVAPSIATKAAPYLGELNTAGDTAGALGTGAAAGLTGAAAEEVVPDKYKPAAEFAGNLVGGGIGAIGGHIGAAVGRKALDAGQSALQPFTEAGRQQAAADILRSGAADPHEALNKLDTMPGEIVPGSKPTTFQVTGDVGLGSAERAMQTADPGRFAQLRAQQNAARLDAVQNIQKSGSPQDMASYLRQQSDALDAQTQGAVDKARTDAQVQAQGLGGNQTPEAYGAALRAPAADAADAARVERNSLYKAVDPDGSLNVVAQPVRQAADKFVGGLSPYADVGAEEQKIFDLAKNVPNVMPYSDLIAFDQRIGKAMRDEQGRTPTWGRLSQIRDAVRGAIDDGVANQIAHERQQVSDGVIPQQQTIESRMADALRQDVEAFYAGRNVGVEGSAGNNAVSPGNGQAAPSSGAGTGRASGSGLPPNAGAQGVPTPNFDEGAAARLGAAKQAHADYKQTYGQGPLGDILKDTGLRGVYRTPDSGVPQKVFVPGNKGFETAQAFRTAVNNDPAAITAAHDYAMMSMKRAAETDGVIDPKKLQAWRDRHEDALRAFPELSGRLDTAAKSTEAMQKAATDRKTAMDDFHKGAVAKVLNVGPDAIPHIVGQVLAGPDRVASMAKLASQVAGDPAAKEGLRRAIVDHMTNKLVGNTEAATSGRTLLKSDQLQSFMKQNEAALAKVFTPEEIRSMRAVALDLQRANRSINAVRIPGGSNTAQDIAPQLEKLVSEHGHSLGEKLIAGYIAHGIPGAAVGAVAHLVTKLRGEGIHTAQDLVKEALLDPELAKTLLMKAPRAARVGSGVTLATKINRMGLQSLNKYYETQSRPLTIHRAPSSGP